MSETTIDIASVERETGGGKPRPSRTDWIAYVYLMRVPIIMGSILVAQPEHAFASGEEIRQTPVGVRLVDKQTVLPST